MRRHCDEAAKQWPKVPPFMTCSLIFIHSRTVFLSRSPSPLPHFVRYMLIKECLQTAWSVAEQSHEMSQVYTRCTDNWQSTFESSVGFFLLSSSYSFILLVRRQTKSNYVCCAFALFKASHIFVTRAINSCSWRGGSWLMSFLFGRMVDIHKSEWIFCI